MLAVLWLLLPLGLGPSRRLRRMQGQGTVRLCRM